MQDLAELELLARVPPLTTRWFPSAEPLQSYLRACLLVIDVLMDFVDDPDRAAFLFRNYPLPEFAYRTPEKVVAEGKTVDLLLKL